MNKKKIFAFAITISGLAIMCYLLSLKSKPNIERIEEIEREIGCDFLFIANKDKKIKYRAEDKFGDYKLQEEMLNSIEKHYKNKNQLKAACNKWKDNKLRFSRNENGLWLVMKPKKVINKKP